LLDSRFYTLVSQAKGVACETRFYMCLQCNRKLASFPGSIFHLAGRAWERGLMMIENIAMIEGITRSF